MLCFCVDLCGVDVISFYVYMGSGRNTEGLKHVPVRVDLARDAPPDRIEVPLPNEDGTT